jgi:simple sugar transport system permease protein
MSETRHRSWLKSAAVWPLAGLLLLALVNLAFNREFFSLTMRDGHYVGAIVDIFKNGSICMILALGMTLVIATGGIDLSVGSVMAIVAAVAATRLEQGDSLVVVFAAALLVGLLCGLVNGLLVSWARIQPIVATLVLMVSGRGIAQLITGGFQVRIANDSFNYLGNGFFFGLPVAPILVTALFLAAWLWLRRSATGLFIEAAGDNETASRFAGLATGRIKCLAYAISGLCAAVAGILASSSIKNANPLHDGLNLELDAIFAVVLGGTALSGGRFNLLGTYFGVLMLQTLTETMYYDHVPSAVAPVPKAVLIILVCLLQSETTRRWFGGLRGRAVA